MKASVKVSAAAIVVGTLGTVGSLCPAKTVGKD